MLLEWVRRRVGRGRARHARHARSGGHPQLADLRVVVGVLHARVTGAQGHPPRPCVQLVEMDKSERSFAVIWEDRGREGKPPLGAAHHAPTCFACCCARRACPVASGDGGAMDSVGRTPIAAAPHRPSPQHTSSHVVVIQRSREAEKPENDRHGATPAPLPKNSQGTPSAGWNTQCAHNATVAQHGDAAPPFRTPPPAGPQRRRGNSQDQWRRSGPARIRR